MDIHILSSGGFRGAYLKLLPQFEMTTGHIIHTEWGGSMGNSDNSIPNRMKRGEVHDLVIMADDTLLDLMSNNYILESSRISLAESEIGIAVQSGSEHPKIDSADDIKNIILDSKTIAISSSASGVYLQSLFEQMGLGDIMNVKMRNVSGEPVAALVARGEAEIGFQQVSELLLVPGVDIVGTLPREIQKVTVFSAGIPVNARNPKDAHTLVEFLSSPAAGATIRESGLEPTYGR